MCIRDRHRHAVLSRYRTLERIKSLECGARNILTKSTDNKATHKDKKLVSSLEVKTADLKKAIVACDPTNFNSTAKSGQSWLKHSQSQNLDLRRGLNFTAKQAETIKSIGQGSNYDDA